MIMICQSIDCHPRSHLFRTFMTASNTLPLFGQELSLLVFVFGLLTCCQGYFWLCLQTLVAAPVKGIWVFYLTSCKKRHYDLSPDSPVVFSGPQSIRWFWHWSVRRISLLGWAEEQSRHCSISTLVQLHSKCSTAPDPARNDCVIGDYSASN